MKVYTTLGLSLLSIAMIVSMPMNAAEGKDARAGYSSPSCTDERKEDAGQRRILADRLRRGSTDSEQIAALATEVALLSKAFAKFAVAVEKRLALLTDEVHGQQAPENPSVRTEGLVPKVAVILPSITSLQSSLGAVIKWQQCLIRQNNLTCTNPPPPPPIIYRPFNREELLAQRMAAAQSILTATLRLPLSSPLSSSSSWSSSSSSSSSTALGVPPLRLAAAGRTLAVIEEERP